MSSRLCVCLGLESVVIITSMYITSLRVMASPYDGYCLYWETPDM